jgi:hypothetical protein
MRSEYLLRHDADPNANLRDDMYTALEIGTIFASLASLAVLEFLLSHEAKLENHSALNMAIYRDRLDVIRGFTWIKVRPSMPFQTTSISPTSVARTAWAQRCTTRLRWVRWISCSCY